MTCSKRQNPTHLDLREQVLVKNFIEKGLKVFKESLETLSPLGKFRNPRR
jgi:hypothetical protein